MTSHDTREHHVKEGELCDVSSKLQIQQSVAVIGKYLKEFVLKKIINTMTYWI